jgi:hypothetical protein
VSEPGKSIYRNALQVSAVRVAAMGENELNALMEMIIEAQEHRCGSALNQIRVNTEVKAPDDGCDGWSGKPAKPDDWLGSDDTVQSRVVGAPEKLRGEVLKEIPRDTLMKGGRFVVIASGSTSGTKGEQDRLKVLIEDADAAGIPSDKLDVFRSDRLTRWCNQHPARAAYWSGRPDGLCTFEEWSPSPSGSESALESKCNEAPRA